MGKDIALDAYALLNAKPTDTSGKTRRTALQMIAGIGYAASTLPSFAQTAVSTPSDGLVSGFVNIDVNGFSLPVYRSAPAGKSNLPVVLVIQEIFGVHEYIADVTRRLAKEGYLAIAPDLYRRQGDASKYDNISLLLSELVSKVPDAQVLADLDATVAWAAKNGGNAKKVGVTGFCWGGRQTWLYAAHNPNVKAAVAWYGKLEGNPSANFPKQPIDVVGELKAPVLGLYGGEDTGIPVTSVNTFKTALTAAAKAGNKAAGESKFVLYPDAPHAFHADYRPSYREAAAKDGWQQALAWFKGHGL
jgi:carboxymethylenebutenolidase